MKFKYAVLRFLLRHKLAVIVNPENLPRRAAKPAVVKQSPSLTGQ